MNSFKQLSNEGIYVFDARRQHNIFVADIEKVIGRHHTTVHRYLRAKFLCKLPKKVDGPAQLDTRSKRNIVKRAIV